MDRRDGAYNAGLVRAGIIVLTLNSAAAVYRAARDVGSVAFVTVSYGALLLLFRCLRAYEGAPPGAAEIRERLKRKVWFLCTLLTTLFAWKVASVMPWPAAAAVVWALAVATSVGGFVALFHRRP